MKGLIFILLNISAVFIFSREFNEYNHSDFIFISNQKFEDIKDITAFAAELNENLNKILKMSKNEGKRKVLILNDYTDYSDYLKSVSLTERDDYIYLKYNIKERNKVVMYIEEDINRESLAHHLTLQYMDFYGNGAPDWFSLGIAAYYEDFSLEKDFKATNKWVHRLKKIDKSNYTNLLKSENKKLKQAVAWLVIDYLINTQDRESNRLFWDTISYIKYSPEQNKEDVINTSFESHDLDDKLGKYLNTLKGYTEYMNIGIDYYNNRQFDKAIEYFKSAKNIEMDKYSPRYYLGMCYSNTDRYKLAYSEFSKSIDLGAPKDLTYYSIGVNFFKEKDYKQAVKYLTHSTKIEGSKYNEMADKLIDEIEKF